MNKNKKINGEKNKNINEKISFKHCSFFLSILTPILLVSGLIYLQN